MVQTKTWNKLTIRDDGTVWIDDVTEYPYIRKYNRLGESDGYLYIQLPGCSRKFSVHRIVAKLFVENKAPDIFFVVDHINRIKTDNRACNLRFVNPHINSINRYNPNCIQFDEKEKLWKACVSVKGELIMVGHFKYWHVAHRAVMNTKEEIAYRLLHEYTEEFMDQFTQDYNN